MVTLALFDTLMSLHNEQLMIDLVLKYLNGAPHIPIAQKHKINKIQTYAKTVDYFLDLAPEVMKNSNKILAEHNSMDYQQPASMPVLTTTSQSSAVSRTIGANWNHYGLHSGETLYSNYHAYLFDAHQKIKRMKQSCDQWTDNYFFKAPPKDKNRQNQAKMPNDQLVQMIRSFLTEFNVEPLDEHSNAASSSGGKQLDSLQSIGESSGYESMKYRPDDDDETSSDNSQQKSNDSGFSTMVNNVGANNVTIVKNVEPWRVSRYREDQIIEMELTEDIFTQGTVSLGKFSNLNSLVCFLTFNPAGPFLTSIWSKLQTFTSNMLYVNLHLTGIISHISLYPLPLVHSILLRPDIPTTSDIPSFYQVLKILKQQIDAELPMTEESLELIDNGRTFLIDREFRLINARKIALEALKTSNKSASQPTQSPSQLQSYDPFKRLDGKRKSIGNPIMNIFRRPSAAPASTSTASNQQGKNLNALSLIGTIGEIAQ